MAEDFNEKEEVMKLDDENKKELTQAEKLLNIASEIPIFHDQNKEAYTFLNNEAVALRSKRIKQILSYKFYKQEGKAPNSDALNQTITVLEGKAINESVGITLNNRIAKTDHIFWYDLGDGNAIKITRHEWEIVDAPKLFKRYSHQQPQVVPISGGNPWKIFQFLNVDEKHQLIVLVYIISCFVPDIPHPIFHPHGAQGAGKTTLCKVIKRLCDPSAAETLITPREVASLVQVIAHHHVCLFDNMSDLPPWMSDILAQACTGGGFSKRQLYTDDEDIIYQVKRAIGLNGINLMISKPDLMDRSILLHLDRITPDKRIDEAEFWKEFEKVRPEILGGILDTLSKAMAIYPTVNLTHLPRMADFVKWGYAISQALGKDGANFLRAYQGNIERQNEEVIQSNTLAQSVLILMNESESWEGTIKIAWNTLRDIADPNKADYTFPKTERMLRKHLERIKTNLMDVGVTFEIGTRTRDGVPISFQKVRDFASQSSQVHNPFKNNSLQCEDTVNMCESNEEGNILSTQVNLLKINDKCSYEDNEAKKHTLWGNNGNGKCTPCIKAEGCMMTEGQRQLCGGPF
jgi:hypothetical protein